jgi:hypothetical protein
MFKWKRQILSVFTLLAPVATFANHNIGFESSEHLVAGEKLKLYFGSQPVLQSEHKLHLSNGLELTYAQIVTMGGDFYAVPGQMISQGESLEERKKLFIEAYNTLAKDPAAVAEVPRIYDVIDKEHEAVVEGLKNGELPETIYARIGDENDRQWNCITGGSCLQAWWLVPGRFLTLSEEDFDHFGDNAMLAYQAGHAIALETAIAARATHDLTLLETAYSMNAYASHFLSDRFASGHMRTPRTELHNSVTPTVIGDLLVSFMHNEENQQGLHVHNLRGDKWVAYGDRYYFSTQNQLNRNRLDETLQASVNEISDAFQSGAVPQGQDVAALIPIPDEVQSNNFQDIAPMFYWDSTEKTLYRRSDVTNVHDNHYTADWWGWTTVALLAQGGLPTASQQALITAGYGDEAMRRGLIKDKSLIAIVKSEASRHQ